MSHPAPKPAKEPQFSFRTKPVQERSVFESYAVLPARTRLRISLAITAFAVAGIFASDYLEKVVPADKITPTPKASS